jgi:hypothetical protein
MLYLSIGKSLKEEGWQESGSCLPLGNLDLQENSNCATYYRADDQIIAMQYVHFSK